MGWCYFMSERSRKVVVLGSINIDLGISVDKMPQQGETKTGTNLIENIGGKGANQALQAVALGCNTEMISAVGNDMFGQRARNYLSEKGLNIDHVFTKPTKTGLAFITRTDQDNRIILYKGSNHALDEQEVENAINGKEGDVFITQFEIPLNIVKRGLKRAKELGMVTILNPAPANYSDDSLYPYVDYFIVNQTEAEILSGIYPNNLEDAKKVYAYFKEKGVSKLIVTLGGDGAVYLDPQEVQKMAAYNINVLDTTGAGDAFVGGLAYAICQGYDTKTMMKIASASGAHACLHVGVENAMGNYGQIYKIMEENNE